MKQLDIFETGKEIAENRNGISKKRDKISKNGNFIQENGNSVNPRGSPLPSRFAPKASYDYIVGIDTGVHTGWAMWDKKQRKLVRVQTLMVHDALTMLDELRKESQIFVRFEDARLRKWFGKTGKEKWQGAGSVKRDAKLMEDYLKAKGIPYEAVAPAANKTKLTHKQFCQLTGWEQQTNEHGRDAAMLVFGY